MPPRPPWVGFAEVWASIRCSLAELMFLVLFLKRTNIKYGFLVVGF
jgi:hypothetical protein